jgi:hypothetical protein
MPNHYILMADVIKSSETNASELMSDLKNISAEINHEFREDFMSPITVTLGDEFQAVVRSLKSGIDVILAFEEAIIRKPSLFKLRYVLLYGAIDTPINPDAAYGMLGPGLIKAGKLLLELKKTRDRYFFHLKKRTLNEKLNLIFRLYQMIVDGWRNKDYGLIGEFLRERDYKKVAEKLNKDRALMWRREKSLKISEYFAARDLIGMEIASHA